jgi:hypothetical protein
VDKLRGAGGQAAIVHAAVWRGPEMRAISHSKTRGNQAFNPFQRAFFSV